MARLKGHLRRRTKPRGPMSPEHRARISKARQASPAQPGRSDALKGRRKPYWFAARISAHRSPGPQAFEKACAKRQEQDPERCAFEDRLEDILNQEACPYTGLPLTLSTYRRTGRRIEGHCRAMEPDGSGTKHRYRFSMARIDGAVTLEPMY